MSRTNKSKGHPPGYEWGSRRSWGWSEPGSYTKKITHRRERNEAKVEIEEQIETEEEYKHRALDIALNEEAEENYTCYINGGCDRCRE